MARTIILGGKNTEDLANKLEADLIEVPDLYVSDLGAINDFVICRLKQMFDVLVIDVDNIQRTDVALALGLYLRLSFAELGANSLVPIIIASDKRIKSFLHFADYSQLLLTENVYFQQRTEIVIEAVSPLDSKKYKTDFLNFINVNFGPEIGRHSLANQWGASVLYRMVSSDVIPQNESLTKAQKSLYFKYVFAKTTENIDQYINPIEYNNTHKVPTSKINAVGKKILLIDDEADKGWADVLDAMFIGKSRYDVIRERVPDYNSLSEDARSKIEFGDYDLIFLDLRMNGIAEENNLEPEKFSGMDILKKIKSLNEGTQVIILTASNKAWNLKALLDAGADGYYTKESPELLFPYEVSYGNYVSLQKTINRCFEREYLRRIVKSIATIKESFLPQCNFGSSINKQLDIAYDLISKAETPEEFAYAYVSLYLIIEIINKEFLIQDTNGNWCLKSNQAEKIKAWSYSGNILQDFSNKYDKEGKAMLDDNGNALVIKFAIGNDASEWQKIVGIVKQEWSQNNDNELIDLHKRIQARNWFIHSDAKLDQKDKNDNFIYVLQREIYTKEGFRKLFVHIEKICDIVINKLPKQNENN